MRNENYPFQAEENSQKNEACGKCLALMVAGRTTFVGRKPALRKRIVQALWPL